MGKRVVVIVLAAAVALVPAAPAVASDDSIRRRGDCTGGPSDWKLVVRQETATTLRVKFEIEGGATGQTWQLFLSDNGTRIFAANRVSREDGYVRVVRETADRAGADLIKATGLNLVTGESCGGSLSF
jgi:hypothetical protein